MFPPNLHINITKRVMGKNTLKTKIIMFISFKARR